ncbi:MAG: sugar kinase [Candidatus Cloacimonetes bacterium]|mgnify:CR=1 FL=1|jgi:sugar/nucleoside kinase (ribokinase family)|nr:sugar kinase [Candidatus Cloacimonadota bacterium]MBT4334130.1 sugar kinase [Candidatus Cloacimonadota bacterium]MBT4575876.1 sugar kinase [Candidatus Cloacimonadota bacterium]MBT5420665.1 sugar kinase [Candidatus Cloacimonadota bacterium]
MSLLIVGSIALDNVKTPFGKVEQSLGGSAVYTSMVSKNFCNSHIVGIVGEDFPKEHFELLNRNKIDTTDLKVVPGRTFHWSGVYNDMNKAETLDTQLNVFADFDPELCDGNRNCDYLFLGNIDPVLQLKVLKQMNNAKITACDTMNFWITGARLQLIEVINNVDILFINEDELKMLTNVNNIYKAAQKAKEMGPKLIVVKRGEYGSFAYSNDFIFFAPVYPVVDVVDPTGAGDSFAGGFMGYIASVGNIEETTIKNAMIFGSVTASFNVESFSVEKLKNISMNNILSRKKKVEKSICF